VDAYVVGITTASRTVSQRCAGKGSVGTHERYETERKGFWLKTSLSRNRFSKSQDIGCDGVRGAAGGGRKETISDGGGGRAQLHAHVRVGLFIGGRFWW
jgi:hypothetical protein